jgi:hypothetical protein
MIKQIIRSLTLLLMLILCRCISHQEKQFFINPESIKKTKVFLSEYADSIQYIPLSFEVPIRSIRAIDFYDDLIFIGAGIEGMLIFKTDGSFYKKIGNNGRGPGEYYSVNSFTIDYGNNLIYILDAGRAAKILVYSFNGDFKYELSNINLQGVFQKIVLLDNKLYLFEIFIAGSALYNWVEIDLNGNVVSTKKNSIPIINTIATIYINPVYKYQNGIGYWNQYNDTLFRIEDGKFSARYFFAKGDFRLPTDNTSELDKYFRVINILESDRYVWIIEINSPTDNVIILDKVKRLSMSANDNNKISLYGITNDVDGGLNFVPKSYFKENGYEYLIGINDAFLLKSHATSEAFKNSTPKYPEKKKELERLANSLSENDNPVLMIVKLKD